MEILSQQTVKAQKDHKCSWCSQTIQKGHHYENSRIVFEGIYTWKSHIHCKQLAEKLDMFNGARDSGEEGVDQEYFIESVNIEYERLMEKQNPEAFNHHAFKLPDWKTRLNYVLGEHNLIVK